MPFMRLITTALPGLCLLAACASTPPINVQYNAEQDFSAYQSFVWLGDETLSGQGARAAPGEATAALEDAIRKELRAKGFIEVEDPAEADLSVKALVGLSQSVVFDSDARTIYAPSEVSATAVNRAGVRRDGAVVTRSGREGYEKNPVARTVDEGTLVVEIFDADSGELVWSASASRDMTDAPLDGRNAEAAMREFLRDFPPQAD